MTKIGIEEIKLQKNISRKNMITYFMDKYLGKKHHPECLKEIKKLKKKVWQIQRKIEKLNSEIKKCITKK